MTVLVVSDLHDLFFRIFVDETPKGKPDVQIEDDSLKAMESVSEGFLRPEKMKSYEMRLHLKACRHVVCPDENQEESWIPGSIPV